MATLLEPAEEVRRFAVDSAMLRRYSSRAALLKAGGNAGAIVESRDSALSLTASTAAALCTESVRTLNVRAREESVLVESAREIGNKHRFTHVGGHPGVDALFPIARESIGGKSDDKGSLVRGEATAELACSIEAVHSRHLCVG